MNAIRNKLAIGIAIAGVTSIAPLAKADAFQLSEGLSMTGFIDMSTVYVDPEDSTIGSDSSSSLDQFEMDFLYDFGEGLTANVDIEYQDDGRVDGAGDPVGEELDVEQAYFNYSFSDELNFKAGRFLSYSGWETEEPTGLFQYSGAGYAAYFYGGYQQGMSVNYMTDMFGVGLSVVNDPGNLEGDATDSTHLATEFMFAFFPADGLTFKAFHISDTDESVSPSEDVKLTNVWGSFASGPVTFAIEMNSSENNPTYTGTYGVDSEASGSLMMFNYAMEKAGVTLRYHEWEIEDGLGNTVEEMSGITLSPSYAINDNLLIVAEYRTDSNDLSGVPSNANEMDSFALEALISW